jgi:hypothetical protein
MRREAAARRNGAAGVELGQSSGKACQCSGKA